MTLGPDTTEQELRRLAKKLESNSDEPAGRLHRDLEADVANRLAYAKALRRAEGSTVAELEAAATLVVEAELTDRKLTDRLPTPLMYRSSDTARSTRTSATPSA